MNVLVEGLGSPMWGTQYPFLREEVARIVGVDVTSLSYGLYLADTGYRVPKYGEKGCWAKLYEIMEREKIDLVFPMIHEGLYDWATRSNELRHQGIRVVISPLETIGIFNDKWTTFNFFKENNISTPDTSLKHDFELLKPRIGRGGAGIRRQPIGTCTDMDGYISQEILGGQEYSVDALCDLDGNTICVVPRKRLVVESGLCVTGEVVLDEDIEKMAREILAAAVFYGPVNMQCFKNNDGIFFTEVNPRLAGGMSLSMHASDNWFKLIVKMIREEALPVVQVNDGLVMMRHYSDIIVDKTALLS